MNGRSFAAVTAAYHGAWLGVAAEVLEMPGFHMQVSAERCAPQVGYGRGNRLLALCRGQGVVLTCRPDTEALVRSLGTALPFEPVALAKVLACALGTEVKLNNKYLFTGLPSGLDSVQGLDRDPAAAAPPLESRPLEAGEYDLFEEFFCTSNQSGPQCREWLLPYFMSMVERRLCHGCFVDGVLLAATDAPDIPYMADVIVEPGIVTRPDARCKGYATAACTSMLESIVSRNLVPLWSCDSANTPSARLARKLGFSLYGVLVSVP